MPFPPKSSTFRKSLKFLPIVPVTFVDSISAYNQKQDSQYLLTSNIINNSKIINLFLGVKSAPVLDSTSPVAKSVPNTKKESNVRMNAQLITILIQILLNVLNATLNVEVAQDPVQKTVTFVETSNFMLLEKKFPTQLLSNVCPHVLRNFPIECFLKMEMPIAQTFQAVQYLLNLKIRMTLW